MAPGSSKPTLPLWVSIITTISLIWGTVVFVLGALIIIASLFGNPGFNDVALYLGIAALVLMLIYFLTPAYRLVERAELERVAALGGRSTDNRFDLQLVSIARARMRSMRIGYLLGSAGAGAFILYGVLLLANRHFESWFGWDIVWWGIICIVAAVATFLVPVVIYNVLMTRERIARRVAVMQDEGVELIDRPLQLPTDDRAMGRPEQGGYLAEGGDCRR